MSLTLEQKYEITSEALRQIGSYEKCNCGCPMARKPYFPGKPAIVWTIANDALKAAGERYYLYEENCSN